MPFFSGGCKGLITQKAGKRNITVAKENIMEYNRITDCSIWKCTLGKIFSGQTAKPRKATLEAVKEVLLEEVLAVREKSAVYETKVNTSGSMVSEPQTAYVLPEKKQGEYTVSDYFARDDEVRCELLDGEFYDMGSPSTVHQIIVRELTLLLSLHVRKNKGRCVVLPSPIDVEFEGDDKTILQPDVAVICDRSKIRGHIVGAPDLVIEIVSPSSRRRDMGRKMSKYCEMEVREYWIVDPEKKKVIVYDFEHDLDIRLYGFGDRVPVTIWDGRCEVDFAEIAAYLKELYPEEG